MREQIKAIVLAELSEIGETLPAPTSIEQGEETRLFGKDGALDSIHLVSLLIAVEQSIEDTFDVQISISSDRAMSQTRSPFRTIGSLTDWVVQLVSESKANG